MLIDAAHPEETRVVVRRGSRVEEFDYESANKKQLRGNIYLAKVTRVEPSLQAAFVDYGGIRHGFLAFNEIHPDYYQIPLADRNLLKEEEAREAAEQRELEARQEEAAEQRKSRNGRRRRSRRKAPRGNDLVEVISEEDGLAFLARQNNEAKPNGENSGPNDDLVEVVRAATPSRTVLEKQPSDRKRTTPPVQGEGENDEQHLPPDADETDARQEDASPALPETVGSEDALEEVPARPRRRRRKAYRIQEVIRRNQIILIQVVKEERGNKGAALTTYISLAGRYTVLMPNTARGGGISRKITNIKDRKRLREIASNIDVPEGTGLIVRTAGASRTKAEIKRDFDYLLRLWENIRQYTLSSTAPTLVYEEGNLIKRSIRDLYSREIDEVLVAGDVAYREAKDFMRLIMPSHAKNVHHYKEQEPLFMRHQVERQLNAMFNPQVKLKSGGYIVINQTEALVAIDVNSGKSTREFGIEETALNTNLEAAREVARQLRLRDLAGLIVIDFIDMDERKNNRAVEQMMKNSLKTDRARIQVGSISAFGLLEMSRQRLRTGVLEGSTTECSHCMGTGIVRSTESVALYVLRSIEDALMSGQKGNLKVSTTTDAALYILNFKRAYLKEIEHHYGIVVTIVGNPSLHGVNFTLEKGDPSLPVAAQNGGASKVVSIDWAYQGEEGEEQGKTGEEKDREESPRRKRSKRPRRRRGRADAPKTEKALEQAEEKPSEDEIGSKAETGGKAKAKGETKAETENGKEARAEEKPRRPRRRVRRGGGRGKSATREKDKEETGASPQESPQEAAGRDDSKQPSRSEKAKDKEPASSSASTSTPLASKPADMGSREKKGKTASGGAKRGKTEASGSKGVDTKEAGKTARTRTGEQPEKPASDAKKNDMSWVTPETEPVVTPAKKRGWWQRKTS